MSGLTILIAAAAAGFAVHHWLKLPVIPLLVLIGFALPRTGLVVEPEALKNLLGLGLAFLVYSAGIELNPRRFTGKLKAVLWIAAAQFLVLALAGFVLALALGFDLLSALYLGGALATSSTLVVIRQLQKRVGSLRAYGKLAIGVLLAQDLAIIVVIVVLSSLPGGAEAIVKGLAAVVAVAVVAYFGQRRLFPWLAQRTRLDDEVMLLILLGVLFVFAGAADILGLPFVVGAFFAGFSLSSFPVSGVARSLLASLRSFFLAIFFTALGALVELPEPLLLLKALAFILLVLLLTPPLVTALAEWKGGLSSRNAINSGLLLAQTSEFSLVLGLYALHFDRTPPQVMSIIAIVAVTTMTITPLLASEAVARRLLQFHPMRRRLATETDLKDHVLMLGLSSEGMWSAKPLREAGHQVVVVDHDPVVIEHLEKAGISCIRGDSTDQKVLSRAGILQAKLILISLPNAQDSLRVLQFARPPETPVIVRVFEEEDAREIERLGGIAILNSHAAADTFMEWFRETKRTVPVCDNRFLGGVQ